MWASDDSVMRIFAFTPSKNTLLIHFHNDGIWLERTDHPTLSAR